MKKLAFDQYVFLILTLPDEPSDVDMVVALEVPEAERKAVDPPRAKAFDTDCFAQGR